MLQDGTAATDVDGQVSSLGSTPHLEGIRRGGECHCDWSEPQRSTVDENLSPGRRRLNRDRPGLRDGGSTLILPHRGRGYAGAEQDDANPFESCDDTGPVAGYAPIRLPLHRGRGWIRNQRRALRRGLRTEGVEAFRQGIR